MLGHNWYHACDIAHQYLPLAHTPTQKPDLREYLRHCLEGEYLLEELSNYSSILKA